MLMPTKILVPTDFSEYSDRALEQALDIGKQYHSKIFLLHVIHGEMHDSVPIDFGLGYERWKRIEDRKRAEIKELMQNQLDKFPQTKEVKIVTNVRWGISYDEILKEEKDKGIELIVIASLGKTGISKYLIGTVARNVLKGSQCPVLLTK
jgi:universal stress protein A